MTGSSPQEIPLSDERELRLTVAEPESVILGGIVVFPEASGITAAVRQLAEGLAREGWLAVIPHLYHRSTADELPEDAARHLARLSTAAVLSDTDVALRWLAARGVTGDRTGLVGFGLGGTVALIVAARRDVGAAVTVAGIGVLAPVSPALPALVEVAAQLRCPWLGVYGADDLPPDEVHKLHHAVSAAQVATDLVHFTDRRTDQATAVEAWTRTLNWFDSHLR